MSPRAAAGGEVLALGPEDPVAEIAGVLARGYIRSLARKAAPEAGYGGWRPETGLDDFGPKSVHGGGSTEGERP